VVRVSDGYRQAITMNWYADFFTIDIPYTALDGEGFVNAAAIFMNEYGVTDCVPNNGYVPLAQFNIALPLLLR
jgi:hypothetical protein